MSQCLQEPWYFCRSCNQCDETVLIKVFGEGTKLIVISPDKAGSPPKPTVFLPSVNEKEPHGIGTYICLLENFFPDVIKVDWKEKNGNKILQSLETRPIKTDDNKYMKLSWLTVTKTSMDKEHVCVVKHEFNKGRKDQEIVFPSINEVKKRLPNTNQDAKEGKEGDLEVIGDESELLQLQFNYITAYYTYVLLLLKSMVYFAIIAFSLFSAGVWSYGKSP